MASSKHSGVMAAVAIMLAVLMANPASAQMGVCYGMLGNNLPSPGDVVSMYRQYKIQRMRLYGPQWDTFVALRNTGIELILDVPAENLQALAGDPNAAVGWIRDVVRPHWPAVRFRYISVGNELIPRAQAPLLLPAMRNMYSALTSFGMQNDIKISTAVDAGVLGVSFPPSAGAFSGAANAYLGPIVQFLASTGGPFLANIYPYFSYSGNPGSISLDYALFRSPGTVVNDGQYRYQNLFDAMLDAFYAAVERNGGGNVPVVVSESGWPSAGGFAASLDNAGTYVQSLVKHVAKGTPRRPGRLIETYIFAMFNENQKTGPDIERNFGLFLPNKIPVYPIDFSTGLASKTDEEGGQLVGVSSM